jgi:hypothetical protein
MKSFIRLASLLIVATQLLTSCSMLTAQGRQERAYERYVRKSSLGRVKQQKRMSFKRSKIPVMEPSAPVETSTLSGPEAVSTSNGS